MSNLMDADDVAKEPEAPPAGAAEDRGPAQQPTGPEIQGARLYAIFFIATVGAATLAATVLAAYVAFRLFGILTH